jgi:multidrug efflux system membrane fusion protein
MNGFRVRYSLDFRRLSAVFQSLIPAFLFTFWALVHGCSKNEQSRPRPDVPVKTAIVIQKDVPVEVAANGTVQAYSVVNITSRVDGQVMKIHLQEGQEVKKGQLLFSIDDRPFQAILEAAQSNLARDRIKLEKAQKDARRYADLFKKDYVTKSQAEQTQTDAESLEAVVKGDEAALENARLNVSFCRIVSPITGRAGSILINEGNLVKANDSKPLMVINQVQPIYVEFSVPEQRLQEIQSQMAIHDLEVLAAAPGRRNETKKGRLTFLDNTIDPNTGVIRLKATFDNKDNSLWPGRFVNVVLLLGMRPQAIVVPSAAIQMGQEGSYVFIVKNDLTVELRDVTSGAQMDDQTVIEKGLIAGETVVTDGQLMLFPGAKVTLKNDTQPTGDTRK